MHLRAKNNLVLFRGIAAILTMAFVAGCGAPAQERTGVSPRAGSGKALLIYDLEGVTAARSGGDVGVRGDGYPAVRESLTEDVNAAIAGLLAGGAIEVVLTDGHGSGNPEPDYMVERMPDGARFEIRDTPYDPYIDVFDDSFAAVACIGMHAGAGADGFLSHTYFGHVKWEVSGLNVNESMLMAASAARFGIPLILVTGDQHLKEEVASFSPRTEYVAVKTALSRDKAEPRPRDEVTAEIRAAAEKAFRNRAGIPSWTPEAPEGILESRFAYLLPEMAGMALHYPGIEPVDNKTVRLETESFLDGYLAFRALANYTTYARFRLIVELARGMEGGPELLRKAQASGRRPDASGFAPTSDDIDRSWSAMGTHGYR